MSGLAGAYDLRNEEEAKEYLEKVGIEYRFQCYGEKLAEGCHRLADFLEAFKGDSEKAKKVYLENCEANNYGHSCFKYANYNLAGKTGPVDKETAKQYYLKGCENGYGPSCHNAALLINSMLKEQSKSVESDCTEREHLLKRACELNDIQSCNLLSTFYITGRDGFPKDSQKAFDYALQACENGHMYACGNISIMYKKGDGVEKNMEQSKRYEDKARSLYKEQTNIEKTLKMSE